MTTTESGAVEAAALARFPTFAERNPMATPQETFTGGFAAGARWGVRTTAALADPRFRQAIAVLAELFRQDGDQ